MSPSRAKGLGSVCLFGSFTLVGSYDRLREVDETLARAAVLASVPLVLLGLYFFVYLNLKKPRKRR